MRCAHSFSKHGADRRSANPPEGYDIGREASQERKQTGTRNEVTPNSSERARPGQEPPSRPGQIASDTTKKVSCDVQPSGGYEVAVGEMDFQLRVLRF